MYGLHICMILKIYFIKLIEEFQKSINSNFDFKLNQYHGMLIKYFGKNRCVLSSNFKNKLTYSFKLSVFIKVFDIEWNLENFLGINSNHWLSI